MRRPEVRYTVTADGVTIAYSTVGQGPTTIVIVPAMVSQLEVVWEEPALEHFLTRLATCARIVLYDRRGTGQSDRDTESLENLGLRGEVRDIEAVLAASGGDTAILVGITLGCHGAVAFAARHPDRTQALVLIGGYDKLSRLGPYDFATHPGQVEAWAEQTARAWGTGTQLSSRAPSLRESARYRAWAARMERHTCSPGAVAALCRWAASTDISPLLPTLRASTLVLHRRGDQTVPAEFGRRLADQIPSSTHVELAGRDHTIFIGDQETSIRTIVRFLDHVIDGADLQTTLRRADRKNASARGLDSLTPAEHHVARLVAAGMTNTEIATMLYISRHTVDGRLRRIFAKLGVNTRVEVTAEIARARLPSPPA